MYNDPSPALQPLIDTGNVQFSYQSTSIQTWLKKNASRKRSQALKVMRYLPGVIATYYRDGEPLRAVRNEPNDVRPIVHGGRRRPKASSTTWLTANGPDIVGLAWRTRSATARTATTVVRVSRCSEFPWCSGRRR